MTHITWVDEPTGKLTGGTVYVGCKPSGIGFRKNTFLHDLVDAAFKVVKNDKILLTESDMIVVKDLGSLPIGWAHRIDTPIQQNVYPRRGTGGFFPAADAFVFDFVWWEENKETLPRVVFGLPYWDTALMGRLKSTGGIDLGGIIYHVRHVPESYDQDPAVEHNKSHLDIPTVSRSIEFSELPKRPFPPVQVNPNRNVVDSQLVESKALFNKPSDVTPQDKVNLPKIILALQYFDGDYEEADALIRLIARMERTKRSDAIFLLSYRYDSKPPREETLGLLREKFATVLCQRGTRLGAGWPTGCNALWLDTMMHAADIGIERRATGVFCFESDVIPIARDWVTSVQKAWMDSSSRGKNVVGHLSPKTLMVPEHVNGNAIFNSQLMRMYPGLSVLPSNFAWDTYLAKDFKRYWEHSNFILNFYKSKDIKPSQILEWQQAGHALVHGIKDGSGRKHISNMM